MAQSGTTDLGANIGNGGGGGSGVSSLNGLTGALTLIPGAGILINPSGSTITISSTNTGTVTSVGLSLPSSVFAISGSPVTTSGTLTGTFNTQTANTVFAGPSSGSPATPTFRALTLSDLPAGTGTVTSVTGTNPIVSSGGTTPNITLNYDNSTLSLNASNQLSVTQMIISDPESNYFWGFDAGINATSSSFGNVGFGTNALTALTTGDYNIAIGDLCGQDITTGSNNIAIGGETLRNSSTSSNNIALGRQTLSATTSGATNTVVGSLAYIYNTTGSNNTAIGYEAGHSSTSLITSSQITLLGASTGSTGADGLTNSTALGFGANITASNQIMLGNTSVTSIVSGTPSVLYNSASPMTTLGDMEYYSSGVQRLGIGTAGQLLTVVAGIPAWQTLSASSISGVITVPNGGTGDSSMNPYAVVTGGATSTSNLQQVSGTGTSGQVLMSNGAGVLPTWQTPSITNGNPSGAQFITSGTTFTTPSTINAATQFKFTLVGGGGGGAGITATTNNASAGGGGGGVGIVLANGLAASTVYTIAIGAGGTGGAAGANAGGNGGNTTLILGATTYTAGFGSGAAATVSTDGGAGGACANTTISINGSNGGSVGVAGTSSISGYGGQAPGYGAVTSGRITTGSGANGTGYGAGGAGAKCSTATAETGGNGAPGAILVEWYN